MGIAAGEIIGSRYRAEALLGRGGTGEVWRCVDLRERRPVAIKAVSAGNLPPEDARRLLLAEVTAVARLGHDGIIELYDLLDGADSTSLLVMQYHPGEPLDRLLNRHMPTWSFVRRVLSNLLQALAHAHARSVLHLDLKPANVLVHWIDHDLRATLVDFGIARVMQPGHSAEHWFGADALVGTPEYMAPEQCRGEMANLGPWTDLYSLGVMAYEMLTDTWPHASATINEWLLKRVSEPAPRLVPQISGVPPQFADLCEALLASDPAHRPWCAADVLAELDAMENGSAATMPVSVPRPPPLAEPAPEPAPSKSHRPITLVSSQAPASDPPPSFTDETIMGEAITATGPTLFAIESEEAATLVRQRPISVSPPQSSSGWRDEQPISSQHPVRRDTRPIKSVKPEQAEQLFTAAVTPPSPGAYALFGLRDLPVLGRDDERQLLWSAVRSAAIDEQVSAVLLSGPTGAGKSRLARDALERALELGLCNVMHTHWSAVRSADEGLRGLLENAFKSRGSSAAQLRGRVRFWLGRIPGEHDAFRREVDVFLRPQHDAAPDAGLAVRVTVDAIERAGHVRTVLLWLDDVQWSRGEAAALLRALAKLDPKPPICVIATCGDREGSDEISNEVAAALRELCTSEAHFTHAHMSPLGQAAIASLVRGLLDLDERLTRLVTERAEGNPLYVVELVRHLVERGAVVRRGDRYSLTDDRHLADWLPTDIEAIWERRVATCKAHLEDLCAMAIVRERPSQAIVEALAKQLGPRFDESLQGALSAGLLSQDGELYRWSDGMLRHYLLISVPQERAVELHLAAAAALNALAGQEDVQEERARHLHAAGHVQAACEALLQSAMLSWRRAEHTARAERLEQLMSWLDAEPPNTWARAMRARTHAEQSQLHAEQGRFEQANHNLAQALEWVRGYTKQAAADAAWIHFRHAQVIRLQGDAASGAQANLRAIVCAGTAGDIELEALNHTALAVDACRRGDLEHAGSLFEQAAVLALRGDNRVIEVQVLLLSSSLEAWPIQERLQGVAIRIARDAGALRTELMARQLWIDSLWQTGQRHRARTEAAVVSSEAARRAMRQTVSIVELQAAYWAIQEDNFNLADKHRAAAVEWGAMSGANVERAIASALDLLVALANQDEQRAESALEHVMATGKDYEEETFRYLLSRVNTLSPTVGNRLTSLK